MANVARAAAHYAPDVTQTDSSPSLDGVAFRMLSSTASHVDPDAPTSFYYRQSGAMVWGEYTGDTVTTGRFIGRLVGDRIEISFAHALVADAEVVMGAAVSAIERRDDGLLYLVEEFEKDGDAHVSVCQEIPAQPTP